MSNIESFQDFLIGILDRLAYPLTILILAASAYNLYEVEYPKSNINSKINVLSAEIAEVRSNAYHNNMYDILKQSETFKKDPGDIRGYDLAKFQRICSDKKFVSYVKEGPGEPFLGDVKESCKIIADLRAKVYKRELEELYKVNK